jgi:putative ABC transport system permease protein
MIRFAIRGMLGRKLRAVLTGIAIVLGVAMISGTYILTDTIDRAFKNLFTESYAGTDVVVEGRALDISIDGESPPPPPIDESLIETVRGVPEVALAAGSVADFTSTKILSPDGEPVSTGGAPTLAFGIDTSPRYEQFNPLELLAGGRWPRDDGEVVIDAGTAGDHDFEIGDTVEITTLQPKRPFEVVGVARYGSETSLGGASLVVFTIPAAQALLDREGQLDQILAAAQAGTNEDELAAAIEPVLPDDAEVSTAAEIAQEASDDVSGVTAIFRYFFLAFAGIALFVGAFVIFNTFSITVAQRTREFATLRTIGASRRQILVTVILESLVIGLLASLVGLALGLVLAEGLQALFRAFGIDLPSAERVFAMRTVWVSLLVGMGVTLAAGLFPALRATRVPPIAAVREGATLPRSRFAPYVPWSGVALALLAVVVLARAMFVDDLGTIDRLLSIAVGVLALFLGVAILSPKVVPPIAGFTSPIARWAVFAITALVWPLWLVPYWLVRYGAWGPGPLGKRIGAFAGGLLILPALGVAAAAFGASAVLVVGVVLSVLLLLVVLVMWLRRAVTSWRPEWPAEFPSVVPDRIATKTGAENARRSPGRTAATAAALMIGVALVAFIATLTDGMKKSNREAIENQVVADYVVTSSDGYSPFVAAAGEALAASPVPELVTNVRSGDGELNGNGGSVSGIEPNTIAEAYVFNWTEGSDAVLATLGRDKAVVSQNYADDHDLQMGSEVAILSTAGRTAAVTVAGMYEPPAFYPLLDNISVSKELFDSLWDRPRNRWTWANVGGDPTDAKTAQLEEDLAGFPDTQVETRAEWIEREDQDFTEGVTFLYVLLTLSVFVSIFGMINTLVLSVYERTREIGMLRAIGMTRRQVKRMIRHESVITALIGAALGLPLGIFLAALVNTALSQYDVQFSIPWLQLAVLTVVAIVIGILAAITPARRAAKLDPLRAIAYE